MSKQEFLDGLRVARNLFVHPRVQPDGSELDPRTLEQSIARAAIWLTPKSVKGFDANDFPELGPDHQRELQTAVSEFVEVARQVPPKEPAPQQQLAAARAAFNKMLSILNPYLPISEQGTRN